MTSLTARLRTNSIVRSFTGFLAFLMIASMIAWTSSARAQTTTVEDGTSMNANNNHDNGLFGGDSRLQDLIVLDLVFNNNVGVLGSAGLGGGTFGGGTFGGSRLGELIVLQELFDDEDGGMSGGGLFDGDSRIGDLIILDRLFAGGSLGVSGTTSANAQFVVVQRGDTLSGIARRFLGDASRANEIAVLNGITNPNLIFPGQVLRLPSVGISGSGVLGGNLGLGGNGLFDLIILDEIFNND